MKTLNHPLAQGRIPEWATVVGQDRYGVFAGVRVGAVECRFRWIPPGRMVLGSPDGEAGRWDDEVEHEVVLTEELWMAETPCTQALWESVGLENRSRFVSKDRPVEMVSFEECLGFLDRINQLYPGLGARLPLEDEWEYACRAGSRAATYAGNLTLRGENDAPELDAIAWYGGNSGVGFELANGYASADWPKKQFAHSKAGSRPVRRKQPNAWGLYDMIGNVWEWCTDEAEYDEETKRVRLQAGGARRILRGGSWGSRAQYCRAAYRYAGPPGDRLGIVGFRLARGQGLVSSQEQHG